MDQRFWEVCTFFMQYLRLLKNSLRWTRHIADKYSRTRRDRSQGLIEVNSYVKEMLIKRSLRSHQLQLTCRRLKAASVRRGIICFCAIMLANTQRDNTKVGKGWQNSGNINVFSRSFSLSWNLKRGGRKFKERSTFIRENQNKKAQKVFTSFVQKKLPKKIQLGHIV